MKIKNIFIGMLMIAAVMLSACSQKQDPEMAAADAELQQKLIGVWYYTDSVVLDDDGNFSAFSAYEFTDKVAKAHDIEGAQISSAVIDKYKIENGEYVVEVDGKKEYALIEIREVDGRDHLYWGIDSGTLEFIRMTDEEIEDFGIPVGQYLTGEAELLGIETTASESETEPETSAVSE